MGSFVLYSYRQKSGYCLVVGRVLAKDEAGVRFSLSAPVFKDKNGVDKKYVEGQGITSFLWISLGRSA